MDGRLEESLQGDSLGPVPVREVGLGKPERSGRPLSYNASHARETTRDFVPTLQWGSTDHTASVAAMTSCDASELKIARTMRARSVETVKKKTKRDAEEAGDWEETFGIAHPQVLPEYNARLQDQLCGRLDFMEDAVPLMDAKGVLKYEGFQFIFKDAFKLYYVASKADQRFYRSIAVQMKNDNLLSVWRNRLRERCRSEGVSTEVLQVWEECADDLWSTAVRNQQAISAERLIASMPVICEIKASSTSPPSEEMPAIATCTCEPVGNNEYRAVVRQIPRGLLARVATVIEGQRVIALNDTGSDLTVMSSGLARHLKLEIKEMKGAVMHVQNPNGTPFTVLGYVQGVVGFNDNANQLDFTAYVLEELGTDFILGDDFLRTHGAVLSYGTGVVRYREFSVTVLDKADFSREYASTDGQPVSIKEDLLIRAEKVVDVIGRVSLPGIPCKQYSWLLEPLPFAMMVYEVEICPGVVGMVSKSAIAAVRIANLNKRDVVIPAGSVVACLRVIREKGGSKTSTIYRLCGVDHFTSAQDGCTSEAEVTSQETTKLTTMACDEEKFEKDLATVVATLPEGLSQAQKSQLEQVMTRFKHVVSAKELGCTTTFQFDIDPGFAQPVCHRDRRFSPLEQTAIKSQMEALLASGLVEPANSPWSSRLVCVPKKSADGSRTDVRVCVDFRDINKLCVRDLYPSPNIEATLDMLSKATWFSAFDLEKGYHQLPLSERAKQICAFRCPLGSFRYTRLPFGIMNAPAAFQRMMDVILQGLTRNCAMVYMDDVIVFSETWESHMENLSAVLERIEGAGLTVKMAKSQFGKKEITFLGYSSPLLWNRRCAVQRIFCHSLGQS